MKILTVAVLTILLIACSQIDNPQGTEHLSGANDLVLNLKGSASNIAKTERSLRKVRLSETLLSYLLGYAHPSFEGCVPTDSSRTSSLWNWNCNQGLTQGLSYHFFNGTALNRVELELQTSVSGFGVALEKLAMTDIADHTDSQGTHQILFKLSWSLYKDRVDATTLVCQTTSSTLTLTVNDAVAGGTVESIKMPNLTTRCDLGLTPIPTDDSQLILTGTSLVIEGDQHLLSGNLAFSYSEPEFRSSGQIHMYEDILEESYGKKSYTWQCAGQPLCFP